MAEIPIKEIGAVLKEFKQFEYQNKVRDQKYDRLELIAPKGKKEEIQKRAAELGFFNKRNQPNVNEYIMRLIEADLNGGISEPEAAEGPMAAADPLEGCMNPPEGDEEGITVSGFVIKEIKERLFYGGGSYIVQGEQYPILTEAAKAKVYKTQAMAERGMKALDKYGGSYDFEITEI